MTVQLEVRPYELTDMTAVVRLWETCFPDDPPWNEPMDVLRRKLTVQPELLLVCLSNGRLVGTVLAGFDGFRSWVNKVATAPDFQRRGVASRLMAVAEAELTKLGCPKLNIQVRCGNDAAIGFYKSLGYTVEPRISLGKRLG